MTSFKELGIAAEVCDVLRYQGIKEPTPVQEQAIPVVRAGRDCIAQAQTGTGKTLAFLLPIFEKIKPQADVAQALVITPTRELAIQIAKVAKSVGEAVGVSSLVIYGGQDIERQKQKLRRHPQLIIGTPGRLLDHLRRGTIDLAQVNKVVLDEADEMLRLGFIEDVETLLKAVAADRQLLLFSATMPVRIKALAQQFMHAPANIEVKSEHITLDAIEQVIVDTTEEDKLDRLCELINQDNPYLMMVFCHTKQRAHQVTMALAARGYLVDELHGDLSQVQRALALRHGYRGARPRHRGRHACRELRYPARCGELHPSHRPYGPRGADGQGRDLRECAPVRSAAPHRVRHPEPHPQGPRGAPPEACGEAAEDPAGNPCERGGAQEKEETALEVREPQGGGA